MSNPDDDTIDPHAPSKKGEVEEKSIRGSGARLVDQNVPDDFEAVSMSPDDDDD